MANKKSTDDAMAQYLSAGKEGTRKRAARTKASLLHRAPEQSQDELKASTADGDQSLVIHLPVSRTSLTAVHRVVDAANCVVSPKNPRNQDLLSANDPEMAQFINVIDLEKQRDPCLARPILVDGRTKYEIIYGSRRLFACLHLGIQVRLWLADIPEVDVRTLSRGENKDRQNISTWEKAADLLMLLAGEYKGKSQAFVAEQEGISEGAVNDYIAIASIPVEFIKMLSSPSKMGYRSGVGFAKEVQGVDQKSFTKAIKGLKVSSPYRDGKSLLKAFREVFKGKVDSRAPRGGTEIRSAEGSYLGKITANRSVKGKYKIDLENFTEEQIKKLSKYIRSL